MSDYLRDPDAIYAQSFAIIRAEADLSGLGDDMRNVAIRMIHACGMVDIAPHIRGSEDVVEKLEFALVEKAPILCDCEMVRAGISRKYLPENCELVVTLGAPAVPALAERLATTRSAAAVELWRDRLKGAVVVIGKAPTALFHLLDLLDEGAARPAAIIATPVGFVGAEESKALLTHLYAHCTQPGFTCRYAWAEGTIAIWDNRCTQHYAVNDYEGERKISRVTILGDLPEPAFDTRVWRAYAAPRKSAKAKSTREDDAIADIVAQLSAKGASATLEIGTDRVPLTHLDRV